MMLAMLMLALPALCAEDAKGESKAIEEAERGWAKGVVANDSALLGKVLADDLTYTHSNGAVDTKESYIGNLKSGKAKYLKLDHSEIKVQQLSKDTALTICRASVVTVSSGKETPANLSLLHVYIKRGGRWQMVAHQSCKVQ
jgi:ketosteroid isomerase-like protein